MQAISLSTARRLSLFAQGLLNPPDRKAEQSDIKRIISQVGVLQIDTINIVARSPYFALWSRLGGYDLNWLDRSLEEKQIFEYWAHAACFLPMEDYPLHRRMMLDQKRLPWYMKWYDEHQAECDAVLAHVKENGPTRSSDFVRQDGQKSGWWNWKNEKHALEYWFVTGELMISKRDKFQRVYDLREQVIPDWRDGDTPDLDTVYREFVLKSIAAMGIVLPGWVADYYRLPKKETQLTLQKLISENRLLEFKVADWQESAWALPEVWEEFQAVDRTHPDTRHTMVLSPFDSLIWDRARARRLFDFDFTIECYLPASKRKYGYYLLPVLRNERLIGRLDAKAHRAAKRFEVKSIHFEEGVASDQQLLTELVACLSACADWHNTPELDLSACGIAAMIGFNA